MMNLSGFFAATSVNCDNTGCKVNGGYSGDLFSLIGVVTQLLIYVVGAASIVMIIFGGLTFVISQGDPGRTKTARETILYAVVGLVISMSALVIVNFVKGSIK